MQRKEKAIRERMDMGMVVLQDLTSGEPLSKGWQSVKSPPGIQLYTKALPSSMFACMFVATVPVTKERLLRAVTDINYMRIWDVQLSTVDEERFSDSLVLRTAMYRTEAIGSAGEVELKTACTWSTEPGRVFYQSETLTEEDNILPDAVEMSTSGFVSVDRTLENGVAGAEIKFVFQFKINVAQSADQQQTFAQGLRLWFDNFVDAAARDPTFNSSPSFQMPSRSSMGVFDFGNSFARSLGDVSAHLPKLPSFSELTLPPSAPNAVPESSDQPTIRAFDVVLPANKTLSQYWAAVFGDYSVPLFILSGNLENVVYSNLLAQMLIGSNGEVSIPVLGSKDSLDFSLFAAQAAAVTSHRKQFFVHLFTFHVSGPSPTIVVAEGNCSGCWTAQGWFIVCELCPLFVKRVGLLQVKNPLVESARFDQFFGVSPLPAAILLPSGVILAANSAFCLFVDADLRSGVLGETFSHVMPAQYKHVVSETMAGLQVLSKSFVQPDQPKSMLLELNFAALSALQFARGHGIHRDSLKCFLLSVLAPESVVKRRRQSLKI